MRVATLTPLDFSSAEEIAPTRFRKQILKMGTIDYKGRKIVFDRPFLRKIVKAFNAGAYDQVPLVLADASNAHNMDPEKFRGEVVALELTEDGLDGIIEATPAGAKVIQSNPRLGVSARIVAGLDKSDGRRFPLAIQHVLATMDPRVTGMRPWQAVTDLSNDDEDPLIVDLSSHPYAEENKVPRIAKTAEPVKSKVPAGVRKPADRRAKKSAAADDKKIDLSALTDEEYLKILDLALAEDDEDDEDEDLDSEEEDDEDSDEDEDSEDEDEDEDESDDDEDAEDDDEEADAEGDEPPAVSLSRKRSKKAMPKGFMKAAKSTSMKTKAAAMPGMALSARDRHIIDLAAEAVRREVRRSSERQWRSERREMLKDGVPPFLLDLATPIMLADEDETGVFDLSVEVKGKRRTQSVSTKDIVRRMLNGVKGMVDLSDDLGHQAFTGPNDPDAGMLAAWESEYGKA